MTLPSWMHSLINRRVDNHSNCLNNRAEEVLSVIIRELRNNTIQLTSESDDGRVNSSLSEKSAINFILTNKKIVRYFIDNSLKLVVPNIRSWYDILIVSDDQTLYVPINIKISNCGKSADNVSSKGGLFYAVTGVIPENTTHWDPFYEQLYKHANFQTNSDYYFVIINKEDQSKSFYTSLKTIKTLRPNGNNLPFQCVWGDNTPKDRQRNRTNKESVCFLLKQFKKSLKKAYKSIKKGIRTINKII